MGRPRQRAGAWVPASREGACPPGTGRAGAAGRGFNNPRRLVDDPFVEGSGWSRPAAGAVLVGLVVLAGAGTMSLGLPDAAPPVPWEEQGNDLASAADGAGRPRRDATRVRAPRPLAGDRRPERGGPPEAIAGGGSEPRRAALQRLAQGSLHVEVYDARTKEPLAGFRYVVHCPGLPLVAGDVTGNRGVVSVRVGMPANLRIESAGYEARELRQIHLTGFATARRLRFELVPSRR